MKYPHRRQEINNLQIQRVPYRDSEERWIKRNRGIDIRT